MKITYQYIGRKLRDDGKLIHLYENLETKQEDAYLKKMSFEVIGCLVEGERTETGIKGPFKVKKNPGDRDLTIFIERDRMAGLDYMTRKEIKKAPKSKYQDVKNQIQNILHGLPARQRKLFLMKLMLELNI